MTSQVVLKARELRRHQTPEEEEFWHFLRDKRFDGFKFRRQHPIGEYIADFCCPQKKLIIELDGAGHSKEYDEFRDAYLSSRRFRVVRIPNEVFRRSRDQILIKILNLLRS